MRKTRKGKEKYRTEKTNKGKIYTRRQK